MTARATAETYFKDYGWYEKNFGKSEEFRGGARNRLDTANEFFTHFNDTVTIPAGLVLTEEGTTTVAATYGVGLGGTAVFGTDDVSAKSDSLNHAGLLWQCNRQPIGIPMVYEAKVKMNTALTTSEWWFGFSDALADTDPIALSATSTFTTSVPTDCAVIGYSATPTSGSAYTSGGNQHTSIAIKADTNTIVASTGGAVAADTYYTYRIHLFSDGNVVFYVDGNYHSRRNSAITATVPLTMVNYAIPRNDNAVSTTIDYLYIGGV